MDYDDVARAAARDVARLVDRRGLRAVVELAARVTRDLGWSPAPAHRPWDGFPHRDQAWSPGAAALRPPNGR
jgi:hypothetical protein